MAVATHQNVYLRPMRADVLDHVLENGAHFPARRRLALAQDHRHRLASNPFVDMDRQETAFVVMGVEQRQLLIAMHRIERIVDVEDDRLGRPPIA